MASFDWLITPIVNNWVTILITSLVTLVAAVVSNYGIKKRFKSAKDKDRQRALEELRTALENLVINNREEIVDRDSDFDRLGLSSERIEDIIDAAEREHQVSLSDSVTPVSLLQDVDLRIKNSRYLDPEQKIQYSSVITEIIKENRNEEHHTALIPEQSAEAIERIEENAEYPGFKEDLEELRNNITTVDSIPTPPDRFEETRRLLVLLTAMSSGMLTIVFSNPERGIEGSPEFTAILFSLLGMLITIIISIQLFDVIDDDFVTAVSRILE